MLVARESPVGLGTVVRGPGCGWSAGRTLPAPRKLKRSSESLVSTVSMTVRGRWGLGRGRKSIWKASPLDYHPGDPAGMGGPLVLLVRFTE